jgi:hypothetical protein
LGAENVDRRSQEKSSECGAGILIGGHLDLTIIWINEAKTALKGKNFENK